MVETLSRRKRFLFGICLLLVVDVIWVVSAEISVYIFQDVEFNKPYFTTYFKTSMFCVLLVGFTFVKRWQYQLLASFADPKSIGKFFHEVERFAQADPSVRSLAASSTNISRSTTPMTDGAVNMTPPTFEDMTDEETSSGSLPTDRKVSFNNVREVRSLARKHGDAQVLARMSHSTIHDLQEIIAVLNKKMSLRETMKLSVMFVVLWMFATLMYQEALALETAAVTNILSSTSGIFTLILAAIFPTSVADKFTLSKLLAVLVSFAGVFVTCWFDPSREPTKLNYGQVFALLGAILYACYLVLIKKKVGADEDKLDIPLFFAFAGLAGMIMFVPGFAILHFLNVEKFQFPCGKTWIYLAVNGLIGTVLSELLWLWGCFLTSSLMATLSLGLVIPLTVIWDSLMKRVQFSWLFIAGIIPIMVSFVAVSYLTHHGNYDPVMDCLCYVFQCCGNAEKNEEEEGLLPESPESPTT